MLPCWVCVPVVELVLSLVNLFLVAAVGFEQLFGDLIHVGDARAEIIRLRLQSLEPAWPQCERFTTTMRHNIQDNTKLTPSHIRPLTSAGPPLGPRVWKGSPWSGATAPSRRSTAGRRRPRCTSGTVPEPLPGHHAVPRTEPSTPRSAAL